ISCLYFLLDDATCAMTFLLSLHDALPIWCGICAPPRTPRTWGRTRTRGRPRPGPVTSRSSRTTPASPKRRKSRPKAELNTTRDRSEEHTSELQSRFDLVCRLLLEKKHKTK